MILAPQKALWQHRAMIEFRTLPNDHPDLARAPLLRAALLTLRYAQEHRAIGLTKTMAFKRVFVHWAVEHFDWPGKSAEEMFRYSKVINEYEFPPIEVLLWISAPMEFFSRRCQSYTLTNAVAGRRVLFTPYKAAGTEYIQRASGYYPNVFIPPVSLIKSVCASPAEGDFG